MDQPHSPSANAGFSNPGLSTVIIAPWTPGQAARTPQARTNTHIHIVRFIVSHPFVQWLHDSRAHLPLQACPLRQELLNSDLLCFLSSFSPCPLAYPDSPVRKHGLLPLAPKRGLAPAAEMLDANYVLYHPPGVVYSTIAPKFLHYCASSNLPLRHQAAWPMMGS